MQVPKKYKLVVDEPGSDTRNHKAFGTEEEMKIWWAVFEELIVENGYSPGGVARYIGLSRKTVHKKIKETRLKTFTYYVTARSIFHQKKSS